MACEGGAATGGSDREGVKAVPGCEVLASWLQPSPCLEALRLCCQLGGRVPEGSSEWQLALPGASAPAHLPAR